MHVSALDLNLLKSSNANPLALQNPVNDSGPNESKSFCHWCGGEVHESTGGILNHVGDDGDIDYDADGDHTPIFELKQS